MAKKKPEETHLPFGLRWCPIRAIQNRWLSGADTQCCGRAEPLRNPAPLHEKFQTNSTGAQGDLSSHPVKELRCWEDPGQPGLKELSNFKHPEHVCQQAWSERDPKGFDIIVPGAYAGLKRVLEKPEKYAPWQHWALWKTLPPDLRESPGKVSVPVAPHKPQKAVESLHVLPALF